MTHIGFNKRIATGLLPFLAVCLVLLSGCAVGRFGAGEECPIPPGEKVSPRQSALFPESVHCVYPVPKSEFRPLGPSEKLTRSVRLDIRSQGLRSWTSLEAPVRRSLDYVCGQPPKARAVSHGDVKLTWEQVRRSLEEFLLLLPRLDREPELLGQRFVWLGLDPEPVMTGYFTPEVEASLTRRPGYSYPIYGVPADLRQGRSSKNGRTRFYRVENGRILPYYDRRALDVDKVLQGRGCEIAWAKDPVDVFYLQVEGCGRLRLPDGSVRNILYGAKNGRKFKGLGRIFLDKGFLPPNRLTKENIKRFLHRHPKRMFDIMAENQSYVFFRLDKAPPEGAMGKPLTPMVSLATDRHLLPLGSVLAFEAEIPDSVVRQGVRGKRRITGIGLAQDTGTAIRGAHVDYYIGSGNKVEPVASRIRTPANLFLLISKDALKNG